MKNKKDDFDRMFDESYQDFINSQKNNDAELFSLNSIEITEKKKENEYKNKGTMTDTPVTKITDINKILNMNPNYKPKLTFEEKYKKWEEGCNKKKEPIKNNLKNNFEEIVKNISLEKYPDLAKNISFTKKSLLQYLIKILDAFVEKDVKKINYFLKCFILIVKERNIKF
ncbi:hypothetical protein TUBRATIS_004210 [Tubulinosema ratisbonensis]|uniref:Uncharacterized protein n=1 Tax=Tubulinosema ratisbonensis TaxID=291195 RepID=A0A437AQ00_9MICR|nr:hypothetical protein TUBRATIS_004210 [Tubulinosema ratisbonensis]